MNTYQAIVRELLDTTEANEELEQIETLESQLYNQSE